MIAYFGNPKQTVYAVSVSRELSASDLDKLSWLFGNQPKISDSTVSGSFIGPRASMVSPWSTNAVEITQNMGIAGIQRIEEFQSSDFATSEFDPMLSQKYTALNQEIFTVHVKPEPIIEISDIAAYNQQEGLSLSDEEIQYLGTSIQKTWTQSDRFGSLRIFTGEFGTLPPQNFQWHVHHRQRRNAALRFFKMIKKTSEENPNLHCFCLQRQRCVSPKDQRFNNFLQDTF
jgi:phosphoribosylformylglycinamidine synthase